MSQFSTRTAAVISCVASLATGSLAATIDFETYASSTDNDFSNNFRLATGAGTIGTPAQTNNGIPVNDYVSMASGGRPVVYDTTPSDGTTTKSTFTLSPGRTLTFTADISLASIANSFGVYIIPNTPTGETAGSSYLALLNVDGTTISANTTTDTIRFATNAIFNTAGAGTLGSTVTGEGLTRSVVTPLTVTYGIDASNDGVFALSIGSLSQSIIIPSAHTSFELGLRLAAQGTATDNLTFDNVSIVVPEPASLAAGALALGAIARRRR